jgi:hypothetical protein
MPEVKRDDRARGVVTLDSIIRSALFDLGESESRYEQFRHFAIEGYRDFHFDLAAEIKTVKLSLTDWKAVTLPIDYVDWVKIGVINSAGAITLFTHDDRINIHHEDEDGYPEAVTSTETLPLPSTPATTTQELPLWGSGDGSSGQLFGLVAKSNGVGYYKFNPQRREIQFAPSIKSDTEVYLEYISDGINPCEKTVVNVMAAKLIKFYIHWQRVKFAKSSNMAQIQMHRKDYEVEYGRVQDRLCKITVEDVLDCARDGYRLTPYM